MDSAGGGGGGAVPWRRQGSGGSVPSSPGPPPPPPMAATGGESGPQQPPPPPPPPMMGAAGSLPSVRLSSEIGPRENKGPPMALAGAMMKDKKPFTYTPGGIDLSEIRSPRMAKRIQMNAAAEGVSSVPTNTNPGQGTNPGYTGPGTSPYLPPAAMAAMNSAMAIPVLPQGGFNASGMNRSQRPTDFVRQEHEGLPHQQPSLPMQLQQQIQQAHQMRSQHGAPPPPSHYSQPSQQPPPPPPTAQHQTLSTSQEHQMNPSRRSPSPGRTTGTGSIYIAPLTPSSSSTPTPSAGGNPAPFSPSSFNLQQQHGPSGSPIHFARQPQQEQHQQQQQQLQSRPGLTKAQAQSQHLGSIYIPPIEQRPSVFGDRSGGASTGTPGTASTPATFSPTSSSESSTPRTPQTPQLNKAPTPWMSSYGRNQNQQQQPPPTPPQGVMSPGQNVTPWGRSVGRTIPIAMARADSSYDSEGGRGGSLGSGRPQWLGPDAQGRVIPIQIQRDGGDHFNAPAGSRQIPIQVEGKRGPGFGIPASCGPQQEQEQQQQEPQSASHRGSAYNSPLSAYPNSSQTSRDLQARQAAAELGTDLETLNVRNDEDNYRSEPIQSKSFKVIQKIAEDGELAADFKERQTTAGERKLLLTDDDKILMDNIKAQVDEGSSLHKTAEPRFRGGHIPSRAFRVLQSNLPPSPGVGGQDFAPSYPVQTGSGPTVHTIPIRLATSQLTQTSSSAMGSSTSTHQSDSRSRAEGVASTGSATDEQGVEPKKYMGGNIPSRSFKILQAMTGGEEDGSTRTTTTSTWTDGADERQNIKKLTSRPPRPPCRSLSSTPTPMSSQNQSNSNNNSFSNNNANQGNTGTTNPGKFVRSRTVSPSPTPRSVNCTCNCTCNLNNNNNPNYSSNSSSYLGSESESEDYAANTPTSPSYSPWSDQSADPNKYDPYAYLQWYYWWYYNYPAYAMAWNNQPYENMDPNAPENYYQYANPNYYDQDPRRMSPYGYNPPGYYPGQRGKSEGRSQEYPRGGERELRREASAPPPEVPKIVIETESPKRPSSVHLLHPNNNYYGNDFDCYSTKTERVDADDSPTAGHEYDEMRKGYEMEDEEWKNKESDSLASSSNPCDSDWKGWEKSGRETDYKQESDSEDCGEYSDASQVDANKGHDAQVIRDELKNETLSSFSPLQKAYRSLSDTNLASNSRDIYDEQQEVVVEEPETPSISSVLDDDAPTLVDESQAVYNSGVIIEECYSPECEMEEPYEESPAERRVTSRLSTIEEMTEQSRATALDQSDHEWRDDTVNEISDEEEEDMSSDDDDEGSSVSVIENKSEVNNDWGGTTTGGESHADEASSCSSSSIDAMDENDDDPLLPTVTVQLPLKLSFSKSSSNQDITTLSVGKSQIQEEDLSTVDSAESDLDEDADRPATQISLQRQDEEDEEPVVSFTISLSPSRSTSKSRQDSDQEGEDLELDKETKLKEHVSDEIDFWSQIQGEEEEEEEAAEEWNETEWKKEVGASLGQDVSQDVSITADVDFWSELSQGGSRKEKTSETTLDFWEEVSSRKTESETEKVNFWDRSPTYETRRLNRQFSWEVNHPVPEEIVQNHVSQSNAEAEKYEAEPRETSKDFPTLVSEDIQPEEPSPKLNSTASNSFTFKTTEEKVKERRESVTRNVESTMKVDTIFSNRKLDNCDFSSVQQQSGTTTSSQRKSKSSCHRGKSSWKGEAVNYVSDENSDESCSTTVADNSGKGGVITGTDSEAAAGNKQQRSERNASNNNNSYEYRRTSTSTKTELTEKNVEVRETLEKLRLGPELSKDSSSSGESDENFFKSDKKERKLERMAKAEDLLWRIERFLQESLSLGSEDDSGVMTDQSRQISDADTDNDVDTEVVTLRQNTTTTSRSQRSLKTRSLVETRSNNKSNRSELTGYENVDTSNVTLRRTNSNSEKKSLRYQRAKTHSRLFQLLQDECSKSEEDISSMEMIDFENLEQVEAAIEKDNKRKSCQNAGREGRRVRSLCSEASLLGSLPANNNEKSLLGSDSTSSSSGVLSPSSPAGRDQLLADIINEFHQRHQSQTRKKVENFPSKIFKLLQQEFGEEFYDTFDCCQDDFDDLPATLSSLSKLLNPQTCSSSSSFSEIKKGKGDEVDVPAEEENSGKAIGTAISSIEEAEEEEQSSVTTTKSCAKNSSSHRSSSSAGTKIEFLEVPARRKKSHLLNRDPRIPKTKKSHA